MIRPCVLKFRYLYNFHSEFFEIWFPKDYGVELTKFRYEKNR